MAGKGGEGGFDEPDQNVHKGSGSKGGSDAGRSKGPSVSPADGGSAAVSSGKKSSADATEQTRNADFAEGGTTKMFGEQEAGSRTSGDKSPSSGKPDDRGPSYGGSWPEPPRRIEER